MFPVPMKGGNLFFSEKVHLGPFYSFALARFQSVHLLSFQTKASLIIFKAFLYSCQFLIVKDYLLSYYLAYQKLSIYLISQRIKCLSS